VINQNSTVNPNGGSAKGGDVLTVYMTGLGVVTNQPADGAAAPTAPNLAMVQASVTATIGGQNAPVSFAGLTPFSVGLYQVNLTVPSGLAAGTYPLVISAGGVANSNKISIAVAGS
jgi:uncharacterized protein (TIGR03437 family)